MFTVEINNLPWTIVPVEANDESLAKTGNPGFIDKNNLKIFLQTSDIAENAFWLSLVRELTRAFMFSYAISVSDEDSAANIMACYCDDIISAAYFVYTELYDEEPPVFMA